MDNEIELISDGDGVAVRGNTTAVERFMASAGLVERRIEDVGAAFRAGASAAQTGSDIAANSARWVKLTQESAERLQEYGLTPTKTPGVSHAMLGQLTGEQVKALVWALNDVVSVLTDAEPADKTELYDQLGISLTCDPDGIVTVESRPVG